MARPWRIQYEGAIYHVMSRGIGRGKIFLTNDDKKIGKDWGQTLKAEYA